MSNSKKILFLVFIICIAACIETDIYLPAFPDMMAAFGATESSIQGLLTWNFAGICLSGPLYGPLSDSWGRKKPLLGALFLFLAGSVLTLISQEFTTMLFGRVLQGLGSGGCFTLGITIIFDAFDKERSIKALNTLNTTIPLVMAFAPMLGGYLNQAFGFRSNFVFITLLVLFSLFIAIFLFKETLKPELKRALSGKVLVSSLKEIATSLPFWQLSIVMSLLFGGYISFLSGSSILFVLDFGMSQTLFPLIQALILGGWVGGSLLLNKAIALYGIPKVKRWGMGITALGGVLFGIATLFAPRDPYLLTLGIVIYSFGANWIVGIYFPEGMELLPHIKGLSSSLFTSLRLLFAAAIVGITSSLYNGSVYPMAASLLLSLGISLWLLVAYEKRETSALSA